MHTIHAVMRHWMFEAVPDSAADAAMDRLAAEEAERAQRRVTYRISCAPPADGAPRKLTGRTQFENAMAATIAEDP